ncbi:DUF2269 family protein, partial [bacterium]|nr:DUF2269 family protein [bacterium]
MLIYITLHIFSVCLFIGNSIISAFWKIMADRTKDIVVIQYATKLINLTDLLFTGTGTVLIAISGQIISENYGGVLSNPWILTSYILLGCSALIWLMVLIPIQLKQSKTIKHITSNEPV